MPIATANYIYSHIHRIHILLITSSFLDGPDTNISRTYVHLKNTREARANIFSSDVSQYRSPSPPALKLMH